MLRNAARNVLKVDPTRTTTMRRIFSQRLKRVFSILRGRILKLVVDEDAFGLKDLPHTINMFCPNGPGGGRDPSCSKEEALHALEGLEPHDDSDVTSTLVNHPLKMDLEVDYGRLNKIVADPMSRRTEETVKIDSLTAIQKVVRGRSIKEMIQQGEDPDKDYLREPVTVIRIGKKNYLYDGTHRATTAKLLGKKTIRAAVYTPKGRVRNVFCPTGEGGGVDPTCPAGAGGTVRASTAKVVSKSDLDTHLRETGGKELFRGVPKAEHAEQFKTGDLRQGGGAYGKGIYVGYGYSGHSTASQIASSGEDGDGYLARMALAKDAKVVSWDDAEESWKSEVTKDPDSQFARKNFKDSAQAIAAYAKASGVDAIDVKHNEFMNVLNPSALVIESPTVNVFCPTGEGGGVDPSCGTGEGGTSKGVLGKATTTLDKIPGAKWLREKTKQMFDKLVARYGKKTALAVVASGQAISWGAFGVGLAVGVPIWIPSAVATAPGAAIAELGHQMRGKGKPAESKPTENRELTQEEIDDIAMEFVRELTDEWNSYYKPEPVTNAPARWRFDTNPSKIKAFEKWLKMQLKSLLISKTQEELWKRYIEDGFRKGAARSFDDVRKPYAKGYAADESTKDIYSGSKEQFLRDTFRQPIAKEKVELVAERTYTDLVGVTQQMATKMTRALADGLVQGKSPRDVARDLNREVSGIGQTRALTIARTELIRAHAEGQLTALEQLGVEEVGVAVEWLTARDEDVCELCEPLEGVVLKLEEAHGMIPRHPNCRCAWIPANVGEDDKDQTRSKSDIGASIRESLESEGGSKGSKWEGADVELSRSRPESILNELIEFEGAL